LGTPQSIFRHYAETLLALAATPEFVSRVPRADVLIAYMADTTRRLAKAAAALQPTSNLDAPVQVSSDRSGRNSART